jgi:hypothetical protein
MFSSGVHGVAGDHQRCIAISLFGSLELRALMIRCSPTTIEEIQ